MSIVFDVKRVENKLFLSFTLVIIFTIVYNLLPTDEIQFVGSDSISDQNNNQNNNQDDPGFFDILYSTTLTQVGLYHPGSIRPKSIKAKLLLIFQLVLAYSIFLL